MLPDDSLNDFVQQAQTMRDSGSSYDDVLSKLRDSQVSIIDCARVLRRLEGLDYAMVKTIIDESPVWADHRQGNAHVRQLAIDIADPSGDQGTS